jgi:hypothetical protein
MLIILAIAISAAALLIVAYPILAKARETQPAVASAQEEIDELLARRDAIFQALRDLNFDHQVGKVTDDDFAVFGANLKESAAEALAAIDQWEAAVDQAMSAALDREIESRRAALVEGERSCPHCHRPALPTDKFCAGCGAPLPAPETRPAPAPPQFCRKCGRPAEPADRFCGGCGAALT